MTLATTHTDRDRERLMSRMGTRSLVALLVLCSSLLALAFGVQRAAAAELTSVTTTVTNLQAGAHSDSNLTFHFATEAAADPPSSGCLGGVCNVVKGGAAKDVIVELPRGFVGNPRNIDRCSFAQLNDEMCSGEAQVGAASVNTLAGGRLTLLRSPVYNMIPNRGEVAQFGMKIISLTVIVSIKVDPGNDYRLVAESRNIFTGQPLANMDMTIWGVPGLDAHNALRKCYTVNNCSGGGDRHALPFLANPSECGVDGVTSVRANSYQVPDVWTEMSAAPLQVSGCEALRFEPDVEVAPTETSPDSPTGLDVRLSFPDTWGNANGLDSPPLKDAVVVLPEGMSINPGSADGLVACGDEDLKLGTDDPVSCPDGSKIGTVTARTPVLEETLSGGVYVRPQRSDDPESGEMFRLALVLENKERGLSVRLGGSVRADAETGQLVTTFRDNPQLPVSEIRLRLKDGPRAPLVTPPSCGTKTVETTLTSWGGQTATPGSSFEIDCDNGLGSFAPAFAAGTVNLLAGSFSPFTLVVARQDGDKELKAIKSVRLPEGLLGRVASVPLCGEAQARAGTCPEASRVGHLQAALGAGSSPLWVPQAGKEPTAVYLSGPYKGAPYSLSIVVPAQAGPFDLGRVVVRSALHVDERTTAISTGIDETRLIDTDGTVTDVLPEALPLILKGIVLRQREIRVIMDREDFMVNPTDCSQKEITAEIYSVDDDRVDVGNPFRAVDCAVLGFAPKFRARILDKGRKSTLRSFHPRTRFTVVPRTGDANIGGARVVLPSSTLLDQANIGTTCTRAQMAERNCPEASIVGYAKAWSPLLRDVVEGPVYLAANGGARPLPDLAAVLDGEIRVVLQGEVSTLRTGGKARLQNTFRVVPDAPVNRFELTMRGGAKRGLLVNSTDLCRTRERGVAVFNGQNGRQHKLRPRILTSFKGCGKVRRRANRQMRSGGGSA